MLGHSLLILLNSALRQVLRHLVSTEGWRGLSKGFSLNVIKGPIALSISLTTYDLLRGYINRYPVLRPPPPSALMAYVCVMFMCP